MPAAVEQNARRPDPRSAPIQRCGDKNELKRDVLPSPLPLPQSRARQSDRKPSLAPSPARGLESKLVRVVSLPRAATAAILITLPHEHELAPSPSDLGARAGTVGMHTQNRHCPQNRHYLQIISSPRFDPTSLPKNPWRNCHIL